jgi:hypothetical protein
MQAVFLILRVARITNACCPRANRLAAHASRGCCISTRRHRTMSILPLLPSCSPLLRVHDPVVTPPLHRSARVAVQRPVSHGIMVHGRHPHLINETAEAARNRAHKMVPGGWGQIMTAAVDARAYVVDSSQMLLNESRAYSVVFTLGSLPGKPGQRLMVTPIGA